MTLAPPVTLALDTATPFLTLALQGPGGVREWSAEVGRAHAERLPDAVRELFAACGLPFQASDIIIGTGPGSYTGVRVGASYALGLARVWGATVRGVSTLQALVRGQDEDTVSGRVAVAMDARRGNVYGAIYEVEGGIVQAELAAPSKYPQAEFVALAAAQGAGRVLQDTPPSGAALLLAGLRHGTSDWALSYL